MTPHILISGSDMSRANYENALTAAGMTYGSYYLPKLELPGSGADAPLTGLAAATSPEFLADFDGLLLAGGEDVNPACYGQENTASGTPDDARDEIELALIQLFMEAGKPILGICRGFQIMNVALGGTLHQDVGETGRRIHTPDWARARETGIPVGDKAHLSRAAEFSFLGQLYGTVFSCNSAHHQSVDQLADPLLAVQWAMEDGCVEGAFHTAYPYIGVQWHPERMCLEKAREDTVDGLPIFHYFKNMFH